MDLLTAQNEFFVQGMCLGIKLAGIECLEVEECLRMAGIRSVGQAKKLVDKNDLEEILPYVERIENEGIEE